ncbi:hypothetical protein MTO96_032508 [Rhipicephalus appendiculatus]
MVALKTVTFSVALIVAAITAASAADRSLVNVVFSLCKTIGGTVGKVTNVFGGIFGGVVDTATSLLPLGDCTALRVAGDIMCGEPVVFQFPSVLNIGKALVIQQFFQAVTCVFTSIIAAPGYSVTSLFCTVVNVVITILSSGPMAVVGTVINQLKNAIGLQCSLVNTIFSLCKSVGGAMNMFSKIGSSFFGGMFGGLVDTATSMLPLGDCTGLHVAGNIMCGQPVVFEFPSALNIGKALVIQQFFQAVTCVFTSVIVAPGNSMASLFCSVVNVVINILSSGPLEAVGSVMSQLENAIGMHCSSCANFTFPNFLDIGKEGIAEFLSDLGRCVFEGLATFDLGSEIYLLNEYIKYLLARNDFLGGGSAGCVLANRLSADPTRTVLLIEAGKLEIPSMRFPLMPNMSVETQMPMVAPILMGTEMDWQYLPEPQQNACLSVKDQRCPWARGKALGGSSAINFMLYVRGNPRDYDIWRHQFGAEGWGYEDVLPHFMSIENSMVPDHDEHYRGTSGEVPVTYPKFQTNLSEYFLKGCQQSGYPIIDYNGRSQAGCSRVQSNTKNGERQSAAKSFIEPVLNRENLHIALRSHVHIDGERATGVSFSTAGATYHITAGREVVISAGAIGSPQLLMLSGIGPEDHLHKMQIPLIRNLPVGENLQDHMHIEGITGTLPSGYAISVSEAALNLQRWRSERKSRGYVKLNTTNPFDQPIIDPKYLTHPEDVKVAVEGRFV